MFALTWGQGQNMGFPDTCLTPVGPAVVPIPYPNVSLTSTCTNPVPTVLMGCLPVMNQQAICAVSSGDEGGVNTGVVSHMIIGPTTYLVGSLGVFADGLPVMRLTSVTGQNCMGVTPNAPGSTIAPSQETVLCLV